MLAKKELAIEACNLTVSYGNFKALDCVDLHIEAGEIVGILGPNGAGKSTFLKLCEGDSHIGSGRLSGFGHDLAVEKGIMKSKISMVLQRPKFSAYATVREIIALFSTLIQPRVNPDELATHLGLDIKLDSKIAKLSGGQRQRLGVLIGLMWGSELILLDEPTSELDPQARRLVWELIRIIADTANSSVLMSTHQMEEAETVCDRVYILDHGKVIASGTPDQIIMEHCEEYNIYFTVNVDDQKQSSQFMPDFLGKRHGLLYKWQKKIISIKDGHDMIFSLLNQNQFTVYDMGIQRSNLEDVFLKLTGSRIV